MAEPEFLIDTNIAIYILADAESPPAIRVQTLAPGRVVTSAIVLVEILRGIPVSETQALASARGLFGLVPVLPFDDRAAEAYARLPFRRGSFDRLIAAHALVLGLTLVTNNMRDFADLPGLTIENWMR